MKKQAQHFGAEYVDGAVLDADFSNRPFHLNIEGNWIETRNRDVASGASARWLGLESEQSLIGHGVSSCATCDGFFYRDKKIMVVAAAIPPWRRPTSSHAFGREVTLVHRRDEFRASKIMLDRARHNPKIKFLLSTVVEEIHDVAGKIVTGVRLRDLKTGKVLDQEVTASSWPSATFPIPGFSKPDRNRCGKVTSFRRAARAPALPRFPRR